MPNIIPDRMEWTVDSYLSNHVCDICRSTIDSGATLLCGMRSYESLRALAVTNAMAVFREQTASRCVHRLESCGDDLRFHGENTGLHRGRAGPADTGELTARTGGRPWVAAGAPTSNVAPTV